MIVQLRLLALAGEPLNCWAAIDLNVTFWYVLSHFCFHNLTLVPEAPHAERSRQQKVKPEAKRGTLASAVQNLTLSVIGFLNSYQGAKVDIWYNDDFYWLSICRHGSEVDNMEVRFSSLLVFLLPSLSLSLSFRVRASGTRVPQPKIAFTCNL